MKRIENLPAVYLLFVSAALMFFFAVLWTLSQIKVPHL